MNENPSQSGSTERDIEQVVSSATPGAALARILAAYPEGAVKDGKLQDAANLRQRIENVADYCARCYEGDLVEIGCLYGGTTLRLARVARTYGRRVICVDPWEQLPYYVDNPFERFQMITQMYSDIIDIVKMRSQEQEAVDYVKARELCFAFVDGEHTYEAVKSDLLTVAHCRGFIAVDDLFMWEGKRGYRDEIRKAMLEASVEQKRVPILSLSREGYLLPRGVK